MNAPGIEQQINAIVDDLTAEFSASHTREQVIVVVDRWRQDIEPAAKIRDFIPILVRRYAREDILRSNHPARVAV